MQSQGNSDMLTEDWCWNQFEIILRIAFGMRNMWDILIDLDNAGTKPRRVLSRIMTHNFEKSIRIYLADHAFCNNFTRVKMILS